jgi:hypothetical protein
MSNLELEINISFGWCSLRLRNEDNQVSVKTHWLVDGFTELVDAVYRLVRGASTVAVRWPFEVAGGHFIDFVVDPRGGLHIAVSEFAHGVGSSTAEQIWSASRGSQIFSAHVTLAEFIVAFMNSARQLRVISVDSTGYLNEWRHSFPQSLYESLERVATARFGYKPRTVDEIGGSISPREPSIQAVSPASS